MTILDALSEFVATAKAGDLPALDRTLLRRHTIDAVVARIVGAGTTEGRAVAALYPAGRGPDSVAALATLVRLTEIDDIHIASCTTPSAVAVPVALALADETPCDPQQLESAIWAGVETVVRVGKAIDGARVLYQGLWPTRTGATLGAAAAAARVWGLSPAATRHALSLAAMLTTGRTGKFHGEPSGRWVIFAAAVGDGVRAASAARAGFTGDPALLEGQWLDRALGVPVDADALTRDLGRTSVYPELSLKPYCTARQALAGAEAMRALVAEGLDASEIEAFTISVPSAYAGMISQRLDPVVRSSAYVSGTGLAAIAALAPESLYDVERASVLSRESIMALARKGEIVADAMLDPLFPDRWPAAIEVRTRSGTVDRLITEPKGDSRNRLTGAEAQEKARHVLAWAGRSDAAIGLDALSSHGFETKAGAAALAKLLVGGGSGS